MKVTKRDCTEVEFDKSKIEKAILKAMKYGSGIVKEDVAKSIADSIKEDLHENDSNVYDIETIVFNKLIDSGETMTAKAYEGYRSVREFQRDTENTTDNAIHELLDGKSEYWNTENSNKNATLVTTQRDYLAGITSEDIARRHELTPDIVQAHDEGIIHFHDIDYFAQEALHNCDLINLEDMLQNGTVINGVMIEKPHRFITAMTIATQIITSVASCQYGGASITLTHLAPFVKDSYKRHFKKYINRGLPKEQCEKFAIEDTKKEIEDGVQTFNYQINSMSTTNGQSPFLSVFMYLGETEEYKDELAMIIEEFLNQRIVGLKNEKGVYVTQAFPKLLYVTEEDNIHEDSKYWYLTKLAAKCTAKRLVPDYMSEKEMKRLKEGNCYPVMGCVDGEEVVTYKYKKSLFVESLTRMWNYMSKEFDIKNQKANGCFYIDLDKVFIYDSSSNDFVKCNRIIKNADKGDWNLVKLSNGRSILATSDHPMPVIERGRVQVKDLKVGDKVTIVQSQYSESTLNMDCDTSWLLGFILCDGCYDGHITSSIALESENDIEENYKRTFKNVFGNDVKTIVRARGEKGNYKDLVAVGSISDSSEYLRNLFGGKQKIYRHIPTTIFESTKDIRCAFLAGMIDADGYINSNRKNRPTVQLGSTNKELAIQTMLLAQSLGFPSKLYINHYDGKNKSKVRYRVEFLADKDVVKYVVNDKKVKNFTYEANHLYSDEAEVTDIEFLGYTGKCSYDVTTDSDKFDVSGISSHNCRSALSPYKDENGDYKFYGRFNQGVVTINLPDVALTSKGDFNVFWKTLDERTELCHKALRIRHNKLKGTVSDVAPILWQHGALARLKKGETIDKLLYGGYSSISLGYAGLYECVKYMTGNSHTDGGKGKEFAMSVMKKLNDKCKEWEKAENIGYGIYGSPIESTTYKFAKCLKKRFGVIKGITDKDYVTNSYHVPVFEKIDAFTKLSLESEFQELSLGGAISYVEMPDMQNNIEAVLNIIKYMYNNIMYAEMNTKSDYCMECGYSGEILTDENLEWYCPVCGNRDHNKLNVSRRTCGYIGINFWNKGRTEEIVERVLHVDNTPVQ